MSPALAALLLAAVTQVTAASGSGFSVSGTQILDATGQPFVMRGINWAHLWYKTESEKAIPAIAATGSNVIRVAFSNGQQWTKDDAASIQRVLDLCQDNQLIAMIEVADATGSNDVADLERVVDYWLEFKDLIIGTEDRVILNIANEWFQSSEAAPWAAAYRSVVPRLRTAGFKHLFVVDSAGYGQEASSISLEGRSIFESDPLRNLIFSIHMYEVAAPDAATVKYHIDRSLAIGVPVIIGEFSDAQWGKYVDYKAILSYCALHNVGWISWSWYGGVGSPCCDNMDLVTDPAGTQLTQIGREIVDGELGIRQTAVAAKIWN